MGEGQPDKQLGYILRSYPRLSQTFILNEILALEQIGVSIQIFALINPHEELVQRQVNRVQAPVYYLDDDMKARSLITILKENIVVARRYFLEYIRSLSYIAGNRAIDRGYVVNRRWECFLQAVSFIYLSNLIEQRTGKKLDHLHAHFAHDPTLIAYLIHRITGIPFSFTAHARDLYQVSEKVLAERIRRADVVITCCRANLDYLNRIAPSQHAKFFLVYHGVNLKDFYPRPKSVAGPDSGCLTILSVGRLVEKKGYQDLLQALLIVKSKGERFRCDIYGDGPLCLPLKAWIEEHGMADDVILDGDCTQQKLISVYQNASFFILTPIQTDDGDRDGIPNVLLEAMAVGLPVITTAVGGIPELVENSKDGLLYQPHDVEGISSGIIDLIHDEAKRSELGKAAAKKVAEQFNISQAANRLKDLFL